MKQVYLIYQDCPMCGARYGWGLEQYKVAAQNGIEIVKLPFYHEKASGLISTAVFEKGMEKMPFFTDGEKFGYSLSDIVEQPTKAKKVKKGAK